MSRTKDQQSVFTGAGRARKLLHVFSTFDPGGSQARTIRIVQSCAGEALHVIAAMDNRFGAADALRGRSDVQFFELTVRRGYGLLNVGAFRKVLHEIRPDVLITYNWGTIEWMFSNLPSIAEHVHIEEGFSREESNRLLLRRSLTRAAGLRLSRCTLATVSETLRTIASNDWYCPARRLVVIPNGVDPQRFRPAPSGRTDKPLVIGTVAGLRAEKRVDRLLRAVALARVTRDVSLSIVGDGPERPALEALAGELGLREHVTFHGHQADPAAFYHHFDLFALTSDTEQMPISLIEAMASGLPAIGTAVGDVPLILSSTPELICSKDPGAVAEAILQLAANDDLRGRVGRTNRERVVADYREADSLRRWRALFGLPCR